MRIRNRKGFTLIELVMIIVVLGILAAVAIPKFIDLQSDAESAAIKGLYGGFLSAYGITIAQQKANPTIVQLNNNISGDLGDLTLNGGSIVNALASGSNTILGTVKTGVFSLTGDPVTAIGSLAITP